MSFPPPTPATPGTDRVNGGDSGSGNGRGGFSSRATRASLGRQFQALFLKNLSLQKRQTKTNLCQILVPIVLVAVIGIMQVVVDHYFSSGVFSPAGLLVPVARDTTASVPCRALKNGTVSWCGYNITLLAAEEFTYPQNGQISQTRAMYNLPIISYTVTPGPNAAALNSTIGTMLPFTRQSTGFLANAHPRFSFDNYVGTDSGQRPPLTTPFLTYVDSLYSFENSFASTVRGYYDLAPSSVTKMSGIYNLTYSVAPLNHQQSQTVLDWIQAGDFDNVRPYGAIEFEHLDSSRFSFEIAANSFQFDETGYETQRRGVLFNMLSNAFLRFLLPGIPSDDTGAYVPIRTYISNMPNNQTLSTIDVSTFAGGFCYAFAASFLLPVFIAAVVKDKQERQLMMMQMSGLRQHIYWFITYVYNYILYTAIVLMITVASLGFKIRLFTQTDPLVLFLVFFIWGHAEITLAFFFSTFFSRARTATVVGYLVVIGGVLTANVVNGLQIFNDNDNPNFFYLSYPPFAFYRAIYLMELNCGNLLCYKVSDLTAASTLAVTMYYAVFSTLVVAVLTAYLNAVLPREFGVRKPWHFVFSEPYKYLFSGARSLQAPSGYSPLASSASSSFASAQRRRNPLEPPELPAARPKGKKAASKYSQLINGDYAEGEGEGEGDASVVSSLNAADMVAVPLDRPASLAAVLTRSGDFFADEDVAAEESRVDNEEYPPACPVVIRHLRKEYPLQGKQKTKSGAKTHVAVHDFCLAIDKNECFGLLGANGAGKTTLISMLTGLYEPTEGTATVAGYDLVNEIDKVQQFLGVCPQFDIQNEDLTCEEHLLFYARLRGVPKQFIPARVEKTLRQINLWDARHRLSKNLSGGMRRRLSLGLAIIGDPEIVVLDEPASALDPASRRKVWDVIQSIKRDRSVILISHGMDEAELLATRIGIMSRGRLKCLGSPLHLKNKYGSGYQLLLSCRDGPSVYKTTSFIHSRFPMAVHVETFGPTITYSIQKDKLNIADLFRGINESKDAVGIDDWGIKMVTLEEVFLTICKRDELSAADEDVALSSTVVAK